MAMDIRAPVEYNPGIARAAGGTDGGSPGASQTKGLLCQSHRENCGRWRWPDA
jgi:hypothetical protein